MADVLRTGSIVAIDQTANSGSQSITVPSDANCIVVSVGGYVTGAGTSYFSNGSITLGGTSVPYRIAANDSSDMSALYALASASLPTGSQTLAWDFEGATAFSDGGRLNIAFYKNVDTTSPVRDTDAVATHDNNSAATVTSGTLTAETGDAIVCSLYIWDGTNPTSVTWTNASSIAGAEYNGSYHAMAEGFPTGNTTVTADPVGNSGNDFWRSLSTIVLAHSTPTSFTPRATLLGVG